VNDRVSVMMSTDTKASLMQGKVLLQIDVKDKAVVS